MAKKTKRVASDGLKTLVKGLGKGGHWGPNVSYTKRGFPSYKLRGNYYSTFEQPDKVTPDQIKELTGFYADKMEKRLKIFYTESQRIEKKVQDVFDALDKLNVTVTKVDVDPSIIGRILNPRAKKLSYAINVEAKHPNMVLSGTMNISPASVKLSLHSPKFTIGRFDSDPIIYIRYYRKMVVKDNIFVTLVKGEKRPFFREEDIDLVDSTKEVPF